MSTATFKVYTNLKDAEQARAFQASQMTYNERFHTLMRLIKASAMIKNAKILSSPIIPEKDK